MSIHFLDLPSEILVLILCSLDLPSLIACIATNRRVKSIIDGSTLLQYRMATQTACVEDNPCGDTTMTSAQRLVALQKRQRAFAELLPSSIHTIPVDNASDILSTFYMLSGGIFAFRDSSMKVLRWISLSSNEQQAPVWKRLELDEYILVFQLAVPEEDLLVVVSSTVPLDANTASNAIIKLRLYEMSTQSAHRSAQEPVINVPIAWVDWLYVDLDVCGPKIALLVHHRLFVYDWKLGRLQMDLNNDYSAATFLSAEVLLLTRSITGSLELWDLEDAAGPKVVLKLPHMDEGCEYHVSRVESNPKGSHTSPSRLPSYASFIDSLVVLQVLLINRREDSQNMFLIIPRRALLQQVPSIENCGQERSWVEWGPPVSRWLHDMYNTCDWPTIICGQRCAFLMFDGTILLLDFNPYAYKRFLLEQAEVKEDGRPTTGRIVLIPPLALDVPNEMELFGVHSQLGYVGRKTSNVDAYDGVMMDEEWIVAVKDTTDSDGEIIFGGLASWLKSD
ncbi:hypothetical protein MVEN_01064700 [Mycena venus]|uniref:F-box domain-containing protein n=1 Tax=Mycena venus TaxID=2733690 RepID=A0A8H6Y6Y5_9AGAR|nr:hypothetical protein MVEN_01064700 [Mycena venus]